MEISENDATSSPANATDSRRKSGRAVRAPQKFAAEAPSSQAGKRKRDGEDDEEEEDVENEEGEEEEESDEGEESADEEEVRETKKRVKATRKPVAKKPKVNGTSSTAEAPTVKLPTRAKKGRKIAIADKNAEGLYAAIFNSGETSNDVAAEWLRQYEEDNTTSMTDLVNCVLKCAGCDLKVTEDDINDPDNVPNKLNDLQEEFKDQNVSDYPLISKAKSSHAFRQSLTAFFQSLVATMHQSTVLYSDIALIENIHLWVTTMSSSFLRPFRHTATVIALACATGLCEAAKEQAEATAQTTRQLETERKRKNSNQGRMATFQEKVDTGNQRQDTCENTIRDFFDTVFVHRYRDVDPKIRTDCVEALGQWIIALPKVFFEGAYLRYLGWLLSDHNGPTRLEVIKQLEKIMKNKDNIGGMRHFIERFRERIVEMATRDAEINVRASAVDLLDMFRAAGVLEPDDIDAIGKLIFDSEFRVRKAVVPFFVENIKDLFEAKIEEAGGEDALEEAFTLDDKNYENPSSGWIRLKCLAEVLLNYDSEEADEDEQGTIGDDSLNTAGFESRYSLAAEVLYDKMPEINNWEVLAGYLLFDHSNAQTSRTRSDLLTTFKLEEKEEVILLDVLNTAVKLTLTQTEDHTKAKDKSKKVAGRVEAKEAQETTARKLATLLPRLLKKFGASPKTAIAVLRLEHALNLEVFQELRQDSTAYADLLYEIKSKFKGHADQAVLKEASVSLLHAQAFDELQEVTEEQINSLWDDTLSDFRKRFPKTPHMSVRGDLKVSLLVELTNAVTRLSKLVPISNPVERFESMSSSKSAKAGPRAIMAPIDMILELVGRGVLENADPEIDEEEDRLVAVACQSALFYFMWKTRALRLAMASPVGVADQDVEHVQDRLETFSSRLVGVLSSRAGLDDLRLLATGTLLELYSLFSIFARKPNQGAAGDMDIDINDRHANLRSLVHQMEPEVQQELTSIFAGAEKQYAKKAKKTLEPPGEDDEPEDIDSEPEDDEENELTGAERQSEILKAERQLCELTSKLIVALFAGAIDAVGPMKGKLRARIARNRNKLGQNFSKIVAHLDDTSKVAKKGQKPKQVGATAKKPAKGRTFLPEAEEEEDADPFAQEEDLLEEGTEEDLRRRELLDEDPPISVDEDGDAGNEAVEDDEVLGD